MRLFRPARPARARWNVIKTLFGLFILWFVFLFLVPVGISIVEVDLGIQRFPPQYSASAALLLGSTIVALWGAVSAAISGQGTPFFVDGTRRIVVMSRKGGVGKTTVTVGVGSTFAAARGDRVVAVDANPDAGNLAHRIAGDCQRTITDLLADSGRIRSFAHMRGYTSQCLESRLEVLASDDDARIAQALDRDAYRQVVALLDHFYSLRGERE